jgi:[1-hydroxy-2-(trimethylamino)ethyl]phosphonate dioxygenase
MTTDEIFDLLSRRGMGRYGLSAVTQTEHALQSADIAVKRNLGDALVIAALFHDVGHLLVGDDVNLAEHGVDDAHEQTSAEILGGLYGRSVAEPVRLHVAAKRYLCAVNPAYYDKLSEDSRQSLAVQGGLMSKDEIAAFDKLEHRAAALALRIIDDEAKVGARDVWTRFLPADCCAPGRSGGQIRRIDAARRSTKTRYSRLEMRVTVLSVGRRRALRSPPPQWRRRSRLRSRW